MPMRKTKPPSALKEAVFVVMGLQCPPEKFLELADFLLNVLGNIVRLDVKCSGYQE